MRDLSRLPKWAQSEIRRLTNDLEYWKAQCRENITETNTFQEIGLRATDNPLPNNSRIRFVLGPRYEEYISVQVGRDGKTLHVMAGSSIGIFPQVTNVIDLMVIGR